MAAIRPVFSPGAYRRYGAIEGPLQYFLLGGGGGRVFEFSAATDSFLLSPSRAPPNQFAAAAAAAFLAYLSIKTITLFVVCR